MLMSPFPRFVLNEPIFLCLPQTKENYNYITSEGLIFKVIKNQFGTVLSVEIKF